MRFLADENIPHTAIESIRRAGHDVESIRESRPAAPDGDIAARAASDERTLITQDLDFGELVARRGLTVPLGVVLFCVRAGNRREVGRFIADTILARDNWAGFLWVVDQNRTRIIPFASHGNN